MRNIKRLLVFLLGVVIHLSYVQAEEIKDMIQPVKISEERTYIVKEGDTLWDITNKYFKNSFQWPKLWRENIFIENPDVIYPGDIIILPGEKEGGASAGAYETGTDTGTQAGGAEGTGVNTEGMPARDGSAAAAGTARIRKTPRGTVEKESIDFEMLQKTGYIVPAEDKSENGKIEASMDGRLLLSESDIIYVRANKDVRYKAGDRLVIFRVEKEIYHPATKKFFGNLVKLLGIAEITDDSHDLRIARIKKSFDYIVPGDKLSPEDNLVETALESRIKDTSESKPQRGFIIAATDEKESSAQHDIVYLDIGQDAGLVPGENYTVLRNNKLTIGKLVESEIAYEGKIVGELEILSVQKKSATAKITKSLDVIFKGDLIGDKI